MTRINDYKKTILMTLLIAPLLTGGLSVGSLQQAYGGLTCGINPSSVNEELNPGESITIPKTIECIFDIDPDMLGLTTTCSGDPIELTIGISIIPGPTSSALMLNELISVGPSAQPGQSATCTLNFDLFEWAGSESSSVEQQITITVPTLVSPIEIDIKPGSDPNSININSRGLIPVAIIGSAVCEVSEIYTDSISFEGASPIKEAFEDVDDDGITDLLLFFRTQDTRIGCGDTEATLTGMLTDNEFFIGTDSIKVVPCIDG